MDSLINHNLIRIFPSEHDLFQAAAEDFAQRAIAAVAAKGEFMVVLSGGNTAKFFFDALIASERRQQRIPWQQIKFFFGDERYVASSDAQSNYYSANQHLFAKISLPAANVYRIPTEFSDPSAAAENYATTLRQVFHLKKNDLPKFDLVYLGLGEDSHTASLMPGSEVVKLASLRAVGNGDPLVAALWAPQFNMNRITLTPDAINHSACICFLVTGENKAPAVAVTVKGPFDPLQHPAQLIHCAGENVIWYLDQAAAGKLSNSR